jgi:hypothetical protein
MLALFFLWMIAVALMDALTVLPHWMCVAIPTVGCVVWLFARPEDFS